MREIRVGEQGAEDAAEDGSAAEFLSGVAADDDVHAPENGGARDGEELEEGRGGERAVVFADDVEAAADETAGDEAGDERDEDARDALEEELDGRRVPRADLGVEGFAVADLRMGAARFRAGRFCVRTGRGGGRLEERLQGRVDGGGFAGAEDELQLAAADVGAEDAGDGGELGLEVFCDTAGEL